MLRRSRSSFSLGILGGIFGLSLCAGVLANDAPLLLAYRGRLYVPLLHPVAGSTFGPNFAPLAADFADPDLKAAISARGWMLWPPIPYRYDSIAWDAGPAPAPPSERHWLGTDGASRDVAARVLYGIRTSLTFGVLLTAASSAVGILAGAAQGYFGGLIDLAVQRLTEVWSNLPQLFLLMLLAGLFAPGFLSLLLILLLFSWAGLTGIARAETLRTRQLDYVQAARIGGAHPLRIMLRHILPNIFGPILALLPFILAETITLLASLDYLGLGMPPGSASLGELAAEAQQYPGSPWLGASAFITIGGILILLILLSEAVGGRTAAGHRDHVKDLTG